MGLPGVGSWTWTLCVLWSWMCLGLTEAGPHYLVAVPAVLEAGAQTRFCLSLLQPNETLVTSVSLKSPEEDTTLLKETSGRELHKCVQFEVPSVQEDFITFLTVEVKGNTFYSKEVRKVLISTKTQVKTFVQTDKPIYLPGQTVHFRVVSLDNNLRTASRLYNIIEIEDTHNNRIGQWLNETSDSKILQLSYSLNSEAREGSYNVIVTIGEDKIYHSFKVEKYVLPKFEVKINAPDKVHLAEEEFTAEVCATYTYGQPVPGSVEVEVCRPLKYTYYEGPQCHKDTQQMDKKGCATFTLKMSNFQKYSWNIENFLVVKAQMEEEGTGMLLFQDSKILISCSLGKLSFIDTPNTYDKKTNFEGKVKVVNYKDTPISGMVLYLYKRFDRILVLTTNKDGVATFTLNTATMQGNIRLSVSANSRWTSYYDEPHFERDEIVLSDSQQSSPGTNEVSSLEVKKKDRLIPCDQDEDMSITYTVAGEPQGSMDLMYVVLSRGAIVLLGHKEIEVQNQSVSEGEVSFKLNVSPEMAPDVQVVAYAVLPSETMMAHSKDFSTEKCFRNKVSLEFSPSSAVPGEDNTLQLTARPDSLCGLSAVDQSVLIKEPAKKLNADRIFGLWPTTKLSYTPYEVQDSVNCWRSYPTHIKNVLSVFQNIGLKVATDLLESSCVSDYQSDDGDYLSYDYFSDNEGSGDYSPAEVILTGSAAASPIQSVRSFFPETWIWDLVEVGDSGIKDVPLTVPDTITTWETEAFCLSPLGFGLAPPKQLTVFQPFFVELTLPYSIIRGEHFELKATTFNYLPTCLMVTVTPTPSLDFTLTPLSGNEYTSCLCADERKTLSWTMVPSALGVVNVTVSAEAVTSQVTCGNEIVSVPDRGRIDVVTRSLIVKPEGTEITQNHNWLLCPKGEALMEEIELELPRKLIEGSARASLSVLGDIMGRALKNLDGLLKMPYGCGEQNMALLAPNIYILQYLKNTQQLTSAIMEKASNFLTSGYQRQLTYKHYDGAYSTFGRGSGNTWLTAFVLRSFVKAQAFIFIDPKKIEQSKIWLESKQLPNGCFQKLGNLFNNRMKGGVSDEVTLSAYIIAAFLEMDVDKDDPVVKKSMRCLKESLGDRSNTYTTALLAYVFTLAGETEARAEAMQTLDEAAISEGGLLHWTQASAETSASLSVEISSYVMLAKLSTSPTTEDLGYASKIVKWLTRQQNQYGGFSSTQDTVVALQALALYSTLVFSPEGSSTVTVTSPSGQLTFDVNQNNKLLYQEKMLQDLTGKYSLEVKGTACTSMQISQVYNIPTPTVDNTLSVKVETNIDCNSKSRTTLTLLLKSLYSVKGGNMPNSTNMVILDIKLLSGFVPDPDSLKELNGALMVDRVEHNEDHILVYLEELKRDTPVNHRLKITQDIPVHNLKPALVEIYDYYQPGDQDEVEYVFPCTEE